MAGRREDYSGYKVSKDIKNQERQHLADMSLLPKRQTVFNSFSIIFFLQEIVNYFFSEIVNTNDSIVRPKVIFMYYHTLVKQRFKITIASLF